MDTAVLIDWQRITFIRSVPTLVDVLRTSCDRWPMGMDERARETETETERQRESQGNLDLMIYMYIYIYIYIRVSQKFCNISVRVSLLCIYHASGSTETLDIVFLCVWFEGHTDERAWFYEFEMDPKSCKKHWSCERWSRNYPVLAQMNINKTHNKQLNTTPADNQRNGWKRLGYYGVLFFCILTQTLEK